MHILVIEDDVQISSYVSNGLKQAGFTVDTAPSGDEGYQLASTGSYDALIVDIMLPGMDGLKLCEKLRKEGRRSTPLLMLTARDTLDDKVAGLEAGTDDYVIKPFSPRELLARIRAVMRRSSPANDRGRLVAGEDQSWRRITRPDNHA